MLETRAIVIETNHQQALVEARHDVSGCGECGGKGCGSSKLSQMFCSNKQRQFHVENGVSARVGDEVVIAIAEGSVLRGVALVYLLPLSLLLLGGGLGAAWGGAGAARDGWAAFGALSGMTLGFVIARTLSQRRSRAGGQPYIARRWQGD